MFILKKVKHIYVINLYVHRFDYVPVGQPTYILYIILNVVG